MKYKDLMSECHRTKNFSKGVTSFAKQLGQGSIAG